MTLWRALLPSDASSPCRVLEPACGSANDYRFLRACGLADRLDYARFDLCDRNVRNARALFPDTRFDVGNVFDARPPDRAYDCAYVHDLFEHLSPEGIGVAAKENCPRWTPAAAFACTSSAWTKSPSVSFARRRVSLEHLSLNRMLDLFTAEGFSGQALHIGTFLRRRLGCEHTHNPHAYTLILGTSRAAADLT